MILLALMTMAAINVDAGTIIPVGTVTGMLVAILIAFFRDSARQDDRVDKVNNQLVEAAERAAELARVREQLLEEKLALSEKRCHDGMISQREDFEIQIRNMKQEFEATRTFQYNRIQELERALRAQGIDPEASR